MASQNPTPTPAGKPAAAPASPSSAADLHKSASLYVGDLNNDVNENILFQHFNNVAPVASVRVCRNMVTRRSLGYAYVNFHSPADAEKAIEMLNYSPINGRACRIMYSQRNPTLRKSNKGNIFIKNLDASIDNKALHDTMQQFGEILSCKIVTDRSGNSRGYGFVHYVTDEAAELAIANVNGKIIAGQEVYVTRFQKRGESKTAAEWTNLYVKHIPESWNDEKLAEVFGEQGPVKSAVIKRDASGKARSFGFVDMETHEAAVACVENLHLKYRVVDADEEKANEEDGKEEQEADASADAGAAEAKGEDDGAKSNGSSSNRKKDNRKFLYVQRAQARAERQRELQSKYEARKAERAKRMNGMNVYIKNLADAVTDEVLRKEFGAFGTITSAKVMTSKDGKSRGFGFVCFSTQDEANNAISEMNGRMLHNKPLSVTMAQPKKVRNDHLRRRFDAPRGGQMPRNMMMGNMFMGPYGFAPGQMPVMMGPRGMMPMGAPMPGMVPGRGMNMNAAMMAQMQMQQLQAQQQQLQAQKNQQQTQQANAQPAKTGQAQTSGGAAPAAPAAAPAAPASPKQLTSEMLAQANPAVRKNMIGERLYPLIFRQHQKLAPKITGMLLEAMDSTELLNLLEDAAALQGKVTEAVAILKDYTPN